MGRRKNKGRAVHGVVLLDKPLKISSNHALQKVKRLFNANKAGHTGSLDPLASGMLPICLGEATKISAFLLDADKTYRFKCKLGERTTTADAEGEVIERKPFEHIQQQDIQNILSSLTGDIMQVPPMYSALKKDGQRLYDLARQGIEVERKARPVTIYSLEILSFENGEVELETRCSKGTYVRTLAEDLAEKLDCVAYVTELRRLSVGPYQAEMITMEQLESLAEQGFDALDSIMRELDSGIADWPKVVLDADSAYYIKLGQPVQIARAPTDGLVRIYAENGESSDFIGVGKIQDDGRIAPKRMMNL